MKKVILLFVLLNSITLYAQDINMPKVVLPSPEAASLFRHIDVPVDHSTGTAEISIPIYTMQTGGLFHPISISYRSSGRQVNDVTGAIGLGWNLNVGGIVSRTIFGKPDIANSVPKVIKTEEELNSLRFSSSDKDIKTKGSAELYKYLTGFYYEYAQGASGFSGESKDTEYDIFSYSIPGYSGKFIIYDGEPLSISLDPVKIKKEGSFVITDELGVVYTFGGSLSTIYTNPTEWLLSSIESPDKKHKISFKYEDVRLAESKPYYTYNQISSILTVEDGESKTGSTSTTYHKNAKYSNSSDEQQYSSRRLSEIDFGKGKVIFDLSGPLGTVSQIKVTNILGETIKVFKFKYSILDRIDSEPTYKLDKLAQISNTSEQEGEIYQFFYNTSKDFRKRNYDYWGYKNGYDFVSDRLSFPSFDLYVHDSNNMSKYTVGDHLGSSNRSPDEQIMKEGMLNKIIYPTGGTSEFEYGINRFWNNYTNQEDKGAGLRIEQIKNISEKGDTIFQTYEYSLGTVRVYRKINYSGYENIKVNLSINDNLTDISYSGFTRRRVFTSSTPKDLLYISNEPIYYSNITEYFGDITKNIGKVDYTYEWANNSSYIKPYPAPSYPTSSGTSTSNYYPSSLPYDGGSMCNFVGNYNNLWRKRNLLHKTEYKYENITKKYKPVKFIEYKYEKIQQEAIHGLKIYKYLDFSSYKNELNCILALGWPVFLYSDYYISRGKEVLKTIEETEYLDNGEVKRRTENIYNSKYLLKENLVTTSSGETVSEEIKYPFDNQNDNGINDKMIRLNMLNYPTKKTKKTKTNTESIYTYYKDFGSDYIKPSQIFSQRNGKEADLRLQYHKYDDYGNPIYITKDDITKIVYLWGYKGMYPIAEINNATYDQVKLALGSTTPESLSNHTTIDSVKIEALRHNTQLGASHISTFYYQPLIGLRKILNTMGIITYYNFNLFGQLESIDDGNRKKLSEYEYNYSSLPLTLNINAANSYCYLGESAEVYAYVTGGSGNYIYNWSLKDSKGSICDYKTNTTSKYIANPPANTGEYIVECEIYDKGRGISKLASTSITVEQPPIEFRNTSYSDNTITADLYSYSSTTVTLEIGLGQERFYSGTKVDCYVNSSNLGRNSVGTNTYDMNISGSQSVRLILTNTNTSPGSNPTQGWVKITKVNKGKIGSSHTLKISL